MEGLDRLNNEQTSSNFRKTSGNCNAIVTIVTK